jgi:hypothetical protein
MSVLISVRTFKSYGEKCIPFCDVLSKKNQFTLKFRRILPLFSGPFEEVKLLEAGTEKVMCISFLYIHIFSPSLLNHLFYEDSLFLCELHGEFNFRQ